MNPPKCPNCGRKLEQVSENQSIDYEWNPETHQYDEGDGTADSTCPDCGEDLYDLFPDGVCNYIK